MKPHTVIPQGLLLPQNYTTLSVSISNLDERIAKLEVRREKLDAEISRLKAKRRPLVAGRASGGARRQTARDAKIFEKYHALGQRYGGVAALATEFGITRRQIHRIIENMT